MNWSLLSVNAVKFCPFLPKDFCISVLLTYELGTSTEFYQWDKVPVSATGNNDFNKVFVGQMSQHWFSHSMAQSSFHTVRLISGLPVDCINIALYSILKHIILVLCCFFFSTCSSAINYLHVHVWIVDKWRHTIKWDGKDIIFWLFLFNVLSTDFIVLVLDSLSVQNLNVYIKVLV